MPWKQAARVRDHEMTRGGGKLKKRPMRYRMWHKFNNDRQGSSLPRGSRKTSSSE
jgi:hypothetical protein